MKNIFKAIMGENSPNLGRERDIQILEVQRTPNKLNKTTLAYNIKLSKVKDKNFFKAKLKRSYMQAKHHKTDFFFFPFFLKRVLLTEDTEKALRSERGGNRVADNQIS